ncbi:MAG: class II aldolase/adducin family protein [Candidatus Hydrogenedentes bacterium]|nr:class II aldolase/adducin family protein [Candidatus Hydrogenedentota bacterium]
MSDLLRQLVEMSRYLGDPSRTYAILGEGNSSARIDSDTFYVKASGTTLSTIDESGFVAVSIPKVMGILEDESAGDDEVTQVLKDALVDAKEKRRPSVETMLHAFLLTIPEYKFIGHTHPTFTNMLLCSKHSREACAGRIFPDHIVSMGHRSVFVPYVDPGLVLAREVKRQFERFVEAEGVLPKAILMQNHGLITMGDSPKAVTSCTDMTEKVSQIIVGTYALGGPNFMSEKDVARIHTRPDEHYRIKSIAG